ncbi:adenosylhomocysteinase [Halomonas cerina]|uniref:Adenosylhomocysteinase n=1 Tax=Halomonas cerina TaxID=447424 RepID=A0A839VA71_9GAMM|nr:NAD(P)-dependent oxidoreductase [Halomonas cerina]MBB3190968.1 adenosylhomocysteinase [Halomonas cerina]
MTYHFHESQLRVFRKYARQERNRKQLSKTIVLVLEHLLPTTEEMLYHLNDAGAEFGAVLAKPYSIDPGVRRRMEDKGFPTYFKSYKELEETDFLDRLLQEALKNAKANGKRILIVDVGGYFAAPLSRLSREALDLELFVGVVEDTTFGHNRYLDAAASIKIPIFSVARSVLKEIEARFVGRDAVLAMDYTLRKSGISLSGRNALVIGYGMIGKNVARALRSADLSVYVYDKHDFKNLGAFIDGYSVHKKRELIKHADIIFSATGDPNGAMTYEEIEECRNNVILASVGSKDTEFDVSEVRDQALGVVPLGDALEEYKLPHSRSVVVAKNGAAVNFILPSIPNEILDLVFSEILLCSMLLLKRRDKYVPGFVHESPYSFLNEVSRDWLRFVNS